MTRKNMQGLDAWGVRDLLWDFWELSLAGELPKDETRKKTFKDIVDELCLPDVDDIFKEYGLAKFSYEMNYVIRKPEYTMTHLWHDEAGLTDMFLCKEHLFAMSTCDDYMNYIPGQTVFCPYCNEDGFLKYCDGEKYKMETYIKAVNGKVVSEDEAKFMLSMAKSHDRFWNRIERQDDLREFKRYILYKLGLAK